MRPCSRKSRTYQLISFSFSSPNLYVVCRIGTVPAASSISWRTAHVRPTSFSPLLNTSLYSRSNFVIAWRSSLLTQPWQAASYNSLICEGTVPRPLGGCFQWFSVISSNDGSTWFSWKHPSIDSAGSFTDFVKGLAHCNKISPCAVSWFRLLGSWILLCAPSTTTF